MAKDRETVSIVDQWKTLVQVLNDNGYVASYVELDIIKQPFPNVKASIGSHELKLDASEHKGGLKATTVSSTFKGLNAFSFSVRTGEWFTRFDRLSRLISGHVEIDQEFDKVAWVQSNNPDQVRHLLNSGSIKSEVIKLGTCLLAMEYSSENAEGTLTFADSGVDITVDLDRLLAAFNLVSDTLKWFDSQAFEKSV